MAPVCLSQPLWSLPHLLVLCTSNPVQLSNMAFTSTAGSPFCVRRSPSLPKRAPLRVCAISRSSDPLVKKTLSGVFGGLLGCGLAISLQGMSFTPPAEAGVVIQQPVRKKIFIGEKKKNDQAKSKASQSGGSSFVVPNFGDVGFLALPLSLVGIAGGAVAAKQLDVGFDDFLDRALIKDSTVQGAGYEVSLSTIKGKKK